MSTVPTPGGDRRGVASLPGAIHLRRGAASTPGNPPPRNPRFGPVAVPIPAANACRASGLPPRREPLTSAIALRGTVALHPRRGEGTGAGGPGSSPPMTRARAAMPRDILRPMTSPAWLLAAGAAIHSAGVSASADDKRAAPGRSEAPREGRTYEREVPLYFVSVNTYISRYRTYSVSKAPASVSPDPPQGTRGRDLDERRGSLPTHNVIRCTFTPCELHTHPTCAQLPSDAGNGIIE